MKLLFASIAILLLVSCQKKVDVPGESVNGDVTESEGAIEPYPCHTTSFVTNYPANPPGKVPPFRFSKTQYASGRIKTINMLSRANPIHAAFKPQAWEVIGSFTYYSNRAVLTGTKQLWEYYKTSTGAAARKSIKKININLTFVFGLERPYDGTTWNTVYQVINNVEKQPALYMVKNAAMDRPYRIEIMKGSDEPEVTFEAFHDWWNTGDFLITSMETLDAGGDDGDLIRPTNLPYNLRKRISITEWGYNPDRNHQYQPTQNWISLEYTICEVMDWTPIKLGQRGRVKVEFYPYNTSYKVTQSQIYRNLSYDSKGNLLTYSYTDGVLQKNTWNCK